MITKDNNGDYIFNLSRNENYYNQRNNEIDPLNSCATTNMIQALEIIGYSFPTIFPQYKQPEDKLIYFIRNDKGVLDFYKKTEPNYYNNYINKVKGYYEPNEIHSVLSYGTNLFMGKNVTTLSTSFSINNLVKELVQRNKPIVVSAKFNNLNHIITLVGCTFKKEIFESKEMKNLNFFDVDRFIIDDTYGNFKTNYKRGTGNDVLLSPTEIITLLKPIETPLFKVAHTFI